MLRWYRKASRHRAPGILSRRLLMERLEDRNSPSALGDSDFYPLASDSEQTSEGTAAEYADSSYTGDDTIVLSLISTSPYEDSSSDLSNNPEEVPGSSYLMSPEVEPNLILNLSYGEENEITLSGQLVGEQVAGRTVYLMGLVNEELTTDADGNFSVTLRAPNVGSIQAMSYLDDGWPLMSSAVVVESNPPAIEEFVCGEDLGNPGWYIFAGRVIDESPGGLTVRFGGSPVSLQGKTAVTDADGWFSLRLQLDGTINDNGIAQAIVTDWYNNDSAIALCDVSQPGVG